MKNEFEIREDHIAIFVNCKGQRLEALISICDLERAQSFPYTWYAYHSKRRDTFIVMGNLQLTKEGRKRVSLSRWIMEPEDNLMVDHINHNTLDNRRENLRALTNGENQQNRVLLDRSGKKRGTHKRKDKDRDVWISYITINNKRIYLGQFDSEEEAFEEASKARKIYMPYSPENQMEG